MYNLHESSFKVFSYSLYTNYKSESGNWLDFGLVYKRYLT